MDMEMILKQRIEPNFFCPLENKSLAFSESIFIFGKIEDLESERQRERKKIVRVRFIRPEKGGDRRSGVKQVSIFNLKP